MPILDRLILALDLLQAGSDGNAIENILDLPGGDMPFTIDREQPALRAPGSSFDMASATWGEEPRFGAS